MPPPDDGGAGDDGGVPPADASLDRSDADGADAADAATRPFRCADHPDALLCASFDEEPYDLGFEQVGSGTISADATFFTSAPRSLVTSLPSRGAGMPQAALRRVLPTMSSFALSWDVRVVTSETQYAVDLCSIYRNNPYWAVTIRYRRDPSPRLELFEYGSGIDGGPADFTFTPLPKTLKQDAFTRLEVRVTRTASSSSATVLVDGEVVVTEPLIGHLYHSTPNALLGISTTDGAGGPITVYTDNVLLEAL